MSLTSAVATAVATALAPTTTPTTLLTSTTTTQASSNTSDSSYTLDLPLTTTGTDDPWWPTFTAPPFPTFTADDPTDSNDDRVADYFAIYLALKIVLPIVFIAIISACCISHRRRVQRRAATYAGATAMAGGDVPVVPQREEIRPPLEVPEKSYQPY